MKANVINKKLEKIVDLLKNKKIIMFGAGHFGKMYIHIFQEAGYEICEVWDNDSNKHNTYFENIIVHMPRYCESVVIIIAVFDSMTEIKNQLLKLGYSDESILNYMNLDILNIIVRKNEEIHKPNISPNTIQFPITYECNFDCVMCGMHGLINKKHMTPKEVKIILSDSLYQNIITVGINGGEPFLRGDLCTCIKEAIAILPNLARFNIITNGYFTEKIIADLFEIKKLSKGKIYINLSISLDGIGEVHDIHRGKKDAFYRVQKTIEIINSNKEKYVDNLDIICTITKNNIWKINELIVWAERMKIDVNYNIASLNVRINNLAKAKNFLLQTDELAKHMAIEFFYGQYLQTGRESYFAIYLYLITGKRYALCPYIRNEWTTILPDGDVEFCPTRSEILGNGLQKSPCQIMSEKKGYFNEIKEKYCETCSHYMYKLSAEGLKLLYEDRIKNYNMRDIGKSYDN